MGALKRETEPNEGPATSGSERLGFVTGNLAAPALGLDGSGATGATS